MRESEPRLMPDGNLQRCSLCGYPFPADVRPSMSVAFAGHLRAAHELGQTTDDVWRCLLPGNSTATGHTNWAQSLRTYLRLQL